MSIATPAPGAVPAPGTPGAPAAVMPEDFQRYGKILSLGTEPAHPLKLSMPLPDVGQIKIPSAAELDMRDKLERLATMSDDEIRQALEKWPAFSKMSLADEGQMFIRIQGFKDWREKAAQDRAHAMGLLTLKPDQFQRFEAEYWTKRMQVDRDLARQFGPVFQAREAQIEEQLFREYSVSGKSVPPPPGKTPPKIAAAPAPLVPPAAAPANGAATPVTAAPMAPAMR